MDILSRLADITPHVLTGDDALPYGRDWVGKYETKPLAVVRPGSTQEVSEILALCHETGTPVVPMGGNTGLTGATAAEGMLVLSLDRMQTIREIRPDARLAVVEAGVICKICMTPPLNMGCPIRCLSAQRDRRGSAAHSRRMRGARMFCGMATPEICVLGWKLCLQTGVCLIS